MFEDRKNIAIAILLFLILVVLGGGAYYLYSQKIKKTALPVATPPIVLNPEEQKQLDELEALRQAAGPKPLAEEAVKKQSEELNSLRQQIGDSLSTQDASGQASELDRLRAQAQ